MRLVAQILSGLALVATMALPCLFFVGVASHEQLRSGLLIAAVVWFATAPLWMERKVGN
jgi:hypothetical protein